MKDCHGETLSTWDENLDLMTFPLLFPRGRFGKCEIRNVKLNDAEFRISRLLNKDSRFRRNQQYLFHLLHDSEMKSLSSSIYHMLQQSRRGMTVDSLLNKIDSGDRELEGSLMSLFRNIRGTKQYWHARNGEVNCMMKNFEPPTWFVTLSCAEYKWDNLHSHLLNINSDLPGIENMTPGELCVTDPVNVCRHFHNRFHSILRNLLLTKENPVLGHVIHHFWRVEYQLRGAPHAHLLLWIDSAPVIGQNSDIEILSFIQKYVTCEIPDKIKYPDALQFCQ